MYSFFYFYRNFSFFRKYFRRLKIVGKSAKRIFKVDFGVLRYFQSIKQRMGNKESSSQKEEQRKHTHPSLINGKEVKRKEQNNIQATFSVPSDSDYDNWKNKLTINPALNAKNAFLPLDHSTKGGMCGSEKAVIAEFPDYWYVLSDEIKNRRMLNTPIQESEVWSLLLDLGRVTSHYHEHQTKVGDLQPKNILLNEEGRAAAITQHSFPGEQTNYTKTLRLNEKTYLAPEESKDISIGYNDPTTDIKAGEAFSLGLTGLDTALMEDSDSLYDNKRNKGEFHMPELDEKRKRLINNPGFSPQLKATLLSMTSANPKERLLPSELNNWLKNYEVQILNNYPFNLNQTPGKVQQSLAGSSVSRVPEESARVVVNSTNPVIYGNTNNKAIIQSKTVNLPQKSNYSTIQQTNSQYVPLQSQPKNVTQETQSQYAPLHSQPKAINRQIQSHYVPMQSQTKVINQEPTSIKNYQPSETLQYRQTVPESLNYRQGPAESSYKQTPSYNQAFEPLNYRQTTTPRVVTMKDMYEKEQLNPTIPQRPASYYENQPAIRKEELIRQTLEENKSVEDTSNKRFNDLFEEKKKEEKDYNTPVMKTAVVNRGNTTQMVNVEVEEDYPEDREKLSVLPTANRNLNQTNHTIPEVSMEESFSDRIKQSYHNPENVSNSNKFVNSPIRQEQSITITGQQQQRTSTSRLPPRMDSLMESEEDEGQYKMSFTSTGRSAMQNQLRQMNMGRGDEEIKSRNVQVPSSYQRSAVLSSLEDETSGRKTMVIHKKKVGTDQ